ncbi:MAG: GNAT family N-acetyltransferase [Bacillota bacterium]
MSKAIEIKQMGMEHFDECMTLSQFAFQYQKSANELEQLKEQFGTEPAVRYAVYVDNQFAAQATVLELETYIGGRRFAMGGLAGVATWPEHRRKGLVAKLLVHSMKEMKDKGQTISFLYPFAFGFYRNFGWDTYTEYKAYIIKAEQLPPRIAYAGRIERYMGSYSLLNSIYDTFASRYNGALVRSELWWKYRISERKQGQTAVYYANNGEPLGYIIYEVKNKQLSVHELIYLNEETRGALWSFISQHDSMIAEVKITVPADDLLPYLLPDPRIKQEVIPYFMARIVDAEAFVEQYAFVAASEEDHIQIMLSDEHASWNNGFNTLQIDADGKGKLRRLDVIERVDTCIKLDIGAFTTMLLGYLRPLQLSQLARIQGDVAAIKRLQARIPERTTYLADFF